MVLFAEEQVRTQRLEGEVKGLNEALRTKHNQTKEVTERPSEELAQAKLLKRGADGDLMQALKSVTDIKAHQERAQLERNMLWEAMKPLALLFRRPKDGEKGWVDIVKEIPNRFESYVRGATKVCVRNVLSMLLLLYSAMDLH